MAVVKDSLSDRNILCCDDIVSSPLLCSGVQCAKVGISVLCKLDSVKDPSAGVMGLKQGSGPHEGYEPSFCNFCVMNLSLTCKVARTRLGSGEGSCKTDSVENSSCDVEHVRYSGACSECEDMSQDQGRTCVKDGDSRCNWRRRRRGIVWWLLLILLGAAPVASGQLRPKTDITTSRSEGGKLCIY
jgi:hypothetical protein